MKKLNLVSNFRFFQNRNGLFWVSVMLLTSFSIGAIIFAINVINNGIKFSTVLAIILLLPLVFFGFRGMKNSLSEEASFFFAKQITSDILSYMGATWSFDEESKVQYILGKKTGQIYKKLSFHWLLLTPIGGTNRLHSLLKYENNELHILVNEFRHAEMYALNIIMKEEKAAIKNLKNENLYSTSFDSGIPLAAYILIASKDEDRVERAIKMKFMGLDTVKAYVVNNASTSLSDIDDLAELPIEWIIKAGGNVLTQ